MKKQLFERLVESMEQHNEIISGRRAPSRKTRVDAVAVRAIRALTKLSQPKFALILDVDVGTLRNWEQGRRYGTVHGFVGDPLPAPPLPPGRLRPRL